jgi:hypothetical protein
MPRCHRIPTGCLRFEEILPLLNALADCQVRATELRMFLGMRNC